MVANGVLILAFLIWGSLNESLVIFWRLDMVNITCAFGIAVTFTWIANHRVLGEMIGKRLLEEERNRFHEDSIRDQLTGLGNRRNFEQSVDFYTSVCRQVHQTVCVIMMDVDFFKMYNDFYGHPEGDEVLKALGRVLRNLAETERAFTARVGGEEFIVLWTENRLIEAMRVARKLRQDIIDLHIPHEMSSAAPYVTVSIGLYVMRGGSQDSSEELYKNADTALYRAKALGRDRIVLHDSADGSFREVERLPPELNVGRQ
jgi:diguanylate cyclase (GGDEF)-like protein